MRALLAALTVTALGFAAAATPGEPRGHAYGRRTPTPAATDTPTATYTATVTPIPTSTPPPVTPVRVVVIGFSDHLATAAAVNTVCGEWVPDIQAWWIAQANRTFAFTCQGYNSPNPISAYGPQDAYGEGIGGASLMNNLFPEVNIALGFGYNNMWTVGPPLSDTYRVWFVIIGAGGWAGTFENYLPAYNQNKDVSVVGDWGLTYELTGVPDAGCMAIYGAGLCTSTDYQAAFGHEDLNSMGGNGLYFGDSLISYPDRLDASPYVAALQDVVLNGQWLYSP